MLTIAQQRHSLMVTESRIIRAEFSIDTVRSMIQKSRMSGSDTLQMEDILAVAEQALKELSEIKQFLIDSIDVKERNLVKVLGSWR
jgi:hypothetical protein